MKQNGGGVWPRAWWLNGPTLPEGRKSISTRRQHSIIYHVIPRFRTNIVTLSEPGQLVTTAVRHRETVKERV